MLEKLKKDNKIMIFNFKTKLDKVLLSKYPKYKKLKIKKDNVYYNESSSLTELKNSIKYFITIISQNCKNFNSDIFLKNVNRGFYDIININQDIHYGINGRVEYINNNCKLTLNTNKVINHELNHMASIPYFNKNKAKLHFEMIKEIDGIYEGYTQLLSERYFKELTNSYIFSKIIARNLEDIIGRNKLESMYYSGNFIALEKELEQYLSKKDICTLKFYAMKIYKIETEVSDSDIIDSFKVETIQTCLDNIYKVLIIGFKNMLKKENYILKEDRSFSKNLWAWTGELNNIFIVHALTEEQYNKVYKEIFDNNIKNKEM